MRTCWLYSRYLGAPKPGRIRQTSAKLGKRWLDAVESRSFRRIEAPLRFSFAPYIIRCRLQSSRAEFPYGTIYPLGLTAKFRSAIRIRSRGNVIAPSFSRSSPRNSFRLIHERRQSSCGGTLEGTMNSNESMITMEISCIVLRLYSLRALGICRFL